MPMIHFQSRFVEAIRNGSKCQTIRTRRKRPIKPGDRLILGAWKGVAYRSKVAVLRDTICTAAEPVEIGVGRSADEIHVSGRYLSYLEQELLAVADGFRNAAALFDWFRDVHGLPFHGVVIRWPRKV